VSYRQADEASGIDVVSATLDGVPVANGQVIDLAAMAGRHEFTVAAKDKAGNEARSSVVFDVYIATTVDVKPGTLNANNDGGKAGLSAFLEFPAGYDVSLIDVSTVTLGVNGSTVAALTQPTAIGDHDGDGIVDRMVRFDRQAVIDALGAITGDVSVTLRGQLSDGRGFLGSGSVTVISAGKTKK
jgi:hypothetical protein